MIICVCDVRLRLQYFDTDRSRTLNKDEVLQALRHAGFALDPPVVQAMMNRYIATYMVWKTARSSCQSGVPRQHAARSVCARCGWGMTLYVCSCSSQHYTLVMPT